MASANIQRVPEVVKAPDFELSSVNGERIKLSRYRGKVVFLSFWTTW
jgi:peroxiredoxin